MVEQVSMATSVPGVVARIVQFIREKSAGKAGTSGVGPDRRTICRGFARELTGQGSHRSAAGQESVLAVHRPERNVRMTASIERLQSCFGMPVPGKKVKSYKLKVKSRADIDGEPLIT
jgi:hypothetical protein